MRYYKVWVSSQSFHGSEALTYSSDSVLNIGSVVRVPLQRKYVVGFVSEESEKPSFATKPIEHLPVGAALPPELIQLFHWLREYYPAPAGQIASLFLPGTIDQKSREQKSQSANTSKVASLPELTRDQAKAVQAITSTQLSVLLHGDTGSGKTRVYIELTCEVLGKNKSAIILTPEIGLTPQLVKDFSGQFPGQTVVVHSHLTPAERRKVWLRIAGAETPLVVIGPRSALFTPLKSVGLIVIDESHDPAYKQEQPPHYLATRVAATLSKLHNAKLILGTATPNVADYFAFESKGLPIIRMARSAVDSNKITDIVVIDSKNRDNFTKSAWLSTALISSITNALGLGMQSLVYLNRRGSARVVMCQKCGWQAACPRCDVPLTYHGDYHKLICHTCGYKSSSPSSCPDCKAIDISYKSIGTKAITDELQRLFPEAKIARFDSDNSKAERLDQQHNAIANGDFDILVGTQMLTKGLDLPRLSTVGIVAADTALTFPDFAAEEITYQQLSQVIGRVRRGHQAGDVVIQSFYPENSALKAAVDKNYSLFYQQQISEREKFLFPPFSYLLRLSCGRKNALNAEKACQKLRTFIEDLHLSVEIIGPAPRFKAKQNNIYYFQLVIKSKKREYLISIIKQLPAQISYDIDPINLL